MPCMLCTTPSLVDYARKERCHGCPASPFQQRGGSQIIPEARHPRRGQIRDSPVGVKRNVAIPPSHRDFAAARSTGT